MDRLGNTHFELAPLENQTPRKPFGASWGAFLHALFAYFYAFLPFLRVVHLDKAPKIFSIWRHIFKFNP